MANTGVKGRIVTDLSASAKGIGELEIHAYDIDPISGDDFLAKTKTDSNGEFVISYSEKAYGFWFSEWKPDIVLRIYGPGKRLLHETTKCSDVEEPTLDVGKIPIHEDNVNGWLVTNTTLQPGIGTPVRLTQENKIEWLIDGDVFPELTEAMKDALFSIHVMNFAFWVSKNLITRFHSTFNYENPPQGKKIEINTIGEQLQEIMKVKAAEGKPVRILLNNIPYLPVPIIQLLLLLPFFLLPGGWTFILALLDVIIFIRKIHDDPDSIDEVKKFFERSKVNIRSFTGPVWWFGWLHAKTVIVDSKIAFVMGASLSQSYFNDPRHLIHDARHGGTLNHDVNLKLIGPAVNDVQSTFTTVWNASDSSATPLSLIQIQPSIKDGASLQVVRTLPGDMFTAVHSGQTHPSLKHGETGVLEAYQRAIVNAKDYIYIEDQYFTSPEIVTALIDRMNTKAASDLQAILVLNLEPDIPGYPEKQIELIRQLQNAIPGYKDRLGIFTIWSFDETKPPYDQSKTPFEILSIYVHSKVGIVDDLWATVGSANLDGASLNETQIETILGGKIPWIGDLLAKITALFSSSVPESYETARPTQHANPQRSSQPPRQTELNLVIYNDIAGQPKTDLVPQLREKLWREHLGYLPNTPDWANFPNAKPASGWLPLWRQRAKEKCEAIKARKKHPAKILEWQHETDIKKYLKASGIDLDNPDKLNVRCYDEAHKFDFDEGKWRKKD